jgi:hypothetical protein
MDNSIIAILVVFALVALPSNEDNTVDAYGKCRAIYLNQQSGGLDIIGFDDCMTFLGYEHVEREEPLTLAYYKRTWPIVRYYRSIKDYLIAHGWLEKR